MARQQATTVLAMLICLGCQFSLSFSFSTRSSLMLPISKRRCSSLQIEAVGGSNKAHSPMNLNDDARDESKIGLSLGFSIESKKNWLVLAVMASSLIPNIVLVPGALANEYEAPTLFTGETVMICTKRGPLGACTKTEVRTAENDNDKSLKYFKSPPPRSVEGYTDPSQTTGKEVEADELIQKLKAKTEENKQKNDLLVRQKTITNNQAATFGPFSQQVVILNTDGESYTLLQNPQAMRLKKAGFIKDRMFVKQPTKEEIDAALESDSPGFGELMKALVGDND